MLFYKIIHRMFGTLQIKIVTVLVEVLSQDFIFSFIYIKEKINFEIYLVISEVVFSY